MYTLKTFKKVYKLSDKIDLKRICNTSNLKMLLKLHLIKRVLLILKYKRRRNHNYKSYTLLLISSIKSYNQLICTLRIIIGLGYNIYEHLCVEAQQQ